MALVDQYGRPFSQRDLREPQTLRLWQLRNEHLRAQLDGLTPQKISETLRQADRGDLIAQHRMFADMEERCSQIVCEMGKRRRAPLCLDWEIRPPRNASAAESHAAKWLTELLEDGAADFEHLQVSLMEAIGHGFSAVENEWQVSGREWLPRFAPIPHEWFQLDLTRSALRLRTTEVEGSPLRPFSWIVHSYGTPKHGYRGRMGLHRTLVWPFVYLAYAIADFAALLEIDGLPSVMGKYPSGSAPEDIDALRQAVETLGHNARGIMPDHMSIEMQHAAGGASGNSRHLAMVAWAEAAISKAILGQTRSAEAKSSGLGSGDADLHNEVRLDIRDADARELAATITRDLLYPLVALNLGGIDGLARCPRLVYDTSEPDDITAYAEAIPKLVTTGMNIPKNWVHERLKIPTAKEGEETLRTGGETSPEAGMPARKSGDPGGMHQGKEGQAGAKIPAQGGDASGGKGRSKSAGLSAVVPGAAVDRGALERDALADLAGEMADEWQPSLAPIRSLAEECADLAQFRQRLAELVGNLAGSDVVDLLARGMFAARLAGQANPPVGDSRR